MILVYTDCVSVRLQYIVPFLFEKIGGVEVRLTSDRRYFTTYSGLKIIYGEEKFCDSFFIGKHTILFEEAILPQEIVVSDWEGTKVFFQKEDKSYDLPFDPFAASFYLLTRYEEYLPHVKDIHERFEANQSIAFKAGFLYQPIIDVWVLKMLEKLYAIFNIPYVPTRNFEFIPTIDIDQACALKNKRWWRQLGSLNRSIIKGHLKDFWVKLFVLLNLKTDPFNQFYQFRLLHKKYHFNPVFFFLIADSYNKFDINLNIKNKEFIHIIREVSEEARIGVHPSYYTKNNINKLKSESARLAKITNRTISISRQHYLRMEFPLTYRYLLEAGIKEDYTMGYASQLGFRAGTCTSFYFFDLDRNEKTDLLVHPFCVMDTTFKTYLKTTPEESLKLIVTIINEVKKVNGTFISLWHNESLSNYEDWKGWEGLYEKMLASM